jgi:Ca2+-binding RTX toxin-like protein
MLLLGAIGLATIIGITTGLDDGDDRPLPTSKQGDRIDGEEGDDVLAGSELNDLMFGMGGNDVLSGAEGDDRIFGGIGDDVIAGGTGDDLLRGGDGTDVAFGQEGDDDLRGDLGGDWLDGGDGADVLTGGFGNDILAGGTGADVVDGGDGDDVLIGSESLDMDLDDTDLVDLRDDFIDGLRAFSTDNPDPVHGGPRSDDMAADVLSGGEGDDTLIAGSGDIATGGEGEDVFVLVNDPDEALSVVTDFESGSDSLVYLYDENMGEPVLDLLDNPDGSQTLSADGKAIATIQNAKLSLADIMLIPRNIAS